MTVLVVAEHDNSGLRPSTLNTVSPTFMQRFPAVATELRNPLE